MLLKKVVMAFVSLGVAVPLFAQGATLAELGTQLQALQALLVTLQAQTAQQGGLPRASSGAAASCPNLTRNLSRGSRGNDAKQLQQFLISQNLLASDSATGFFGALTEAAIKQWQSRNGIVSSGTPSATGYGVVGPKTRAALAKCSTPSISVTQPNPTSTPTLQPSPPPTISNPDSHIPPATSSCSPLASQMQTFSCPTGQTGSIAQTRMSSCPGPTWGAWMTTTSTCAVAADNSSKNVKDFGALCDAVENPSSVNGGAATGHDDFPAFAAAVAALPATGGTIIVPRIGANKCLWKLQAGANPSLKLPNNTTLQIDDGVRILVEGTPNGVNGYSNGAVVNNFSMYGGNFNINVIGGSFKAAGPNSGSVFVALKRLYGGKIHTRFLDNNGSARGQIAYSTDVDVDIYVGYENGPWTKIVQPGNGGNKWAFEDGFRIGSGSSNIHIQGEIHSGDDSIALNNEWSETDSSNVGADIHHITIGPVTATSEAGNTLRIYQQAEMTSGMTHDVFVSNLTGTPVSVGNGATGISIADYSNRRAITDITLNTVSLDVNGVFGTNAGAVSVINTNRIKFFNLNVTGANVYGAGAADGLNTEYHNVTILGNPGSVDGIIFSPYGPTASGGSDGSLVDGGQISGFGRDKVHIEGSNNVTVSGL